MGLVSFLNLAGANLVVQHDGALITGSNVLHSKFVRIVEGIYFFVGPLFAGTNHFQGLSVLSKGDSVLGNVPSER